MSIIKKINHQDGYLSKQVYDLLRNHILQGDFKPGIRLIETELANEFGISRTPVREALNLLQRDGLINSGPQGNYVTEICLKDIHEIYGLRKVIEPYAIELAVERAKPQDLIRLESLVKETEVYKEAVDLDKMFVVNSRFHEFIHKISNNTRLQRIMKSLNDPISKYRRATLRSKIRAQESYEAHLAILNAFKNKDKEEARRLLLDDIITGQKAIEQLAKEC